jgi:RNA polymerase sigma-70 factor (ECF subfamily)
MMRAQVHLLRPVRFSSKEPDRVAPDQDKSISDTELLRRYLAGDEGAFAALVHRYEKELYNFLARFTGDRALAEDLFQETFLQLHVSAATFDQARRLKPWLFTIAANKARDALRRRTRHQAAPLDATIAGSADERTTYGDLMPSDVPPPEESLLNLEDRRAVESIVSEMPEHLRTVLVLSYFSDLPYQEIADVLGVPLGTVKSRLHAAVRQFASRWKAIASKKT